MRQPAPPGYALDFTLASHEDALHVRAELAAYGVPAELREGGPRLALTLPEDDLVLARHLCPELGAPAARRRLPRPASPPRALTRRSWARRAALTLAASALPLGFALGMTVSSAPLGGSGLGWSPSGRAFHGDANGDGRVDRIVEFGADERPRAVWVDIDQDGRIDQLIQIEPGLRAAVRPAGARMSDG